MGKHAANGQIRAALKAGAKTFARGKTDALQYGDADAARKALGEAMLTIEFVVIRAGQPRVVERVGSAGDRLVYAEQAARGLLDDVRQRHPKDPPDGFQIIGENGAVAFRSWEGR